MGVTNFDGIKANYYIGLPDSGGGASFPVESTGKTFYVGNSTVLPEGGMAGSNGNSGESPLEPFATLDYAVGRCVANRGDIIKVMPSHAETLAAAGAVTVDVAGITIEGLGVGDVRPFFTFSAVASTFLVSANDVVIKNIVGIPSIDSVTNAFVVSGNEVSLDLEWQDASAAIEAITAVRLDTADGGELNLVYKGFTAGNAAVRAVAVDDCDNVDIVIDGYGVVTTAWVNLVDVASTNVKVRGVLYTQGVADFTRDVVDTVGGSTWSADIFDASFGGKVSGGSAAALASDDVSALAAAVAVIDEFHDVPAANNVLNAQINEVIGNKTDATAAGAVTGTDTLVGYVKQLVTELQVVDEFHDVPAADNVLNAQINEVVGNKTDAAAAGAVTGTDTLVGYTKQLVTEGIARDAAIAVIDGFHDVPGADVVTNAQSRDVVGNKTDAAIADTIEGAAAATQSLDALVKAVLQRIGADSVNNTAATTLVAANDDGSILERMEAMAGASSVLRTVNAPNHLAVTADFTNAIWNTVATHEIATVTGLVEVFIVPIVTGTLTDAANAATIQLGIAGSTSAMIAATGAAGSGGTTLDLNEFWVDATPADVVISRTQVLQFIVGAGLDIGYEIAGEALTGGSIVFNIWWSPLDATGAVVAGAGGVL